jgi:NADH:ubiquinone oxidoreductase subunit F (NADH-binding)
MSGLVEVPMGTTFDTIVNDILGGVRKGQIPQSASCRRSHGMHASCGPDGCACDL